MAVHTMIHGLVLSDISLEGTATYRGITPKAG